VVCALVGWNEVFIVWCITIFEKGENNMGWMLYEIGAASYRYSKRVVSFLLEYI